MMHSFKKENHFLLSKNITSKLFNQFVSSVLTNNDNFTTFFSHSKHNISKHN